MEHFSNIGFRLLSIICLFLFSVNFLECKTPINIFEINDPAIDSTTQEFNLNIYTPVLDLNPCNDFIEVASSVGFTINDKVLIVQMQGATIDTQNHLGYGTVVQYNDAGNYEFGIIEDIISNKIYLQNPLLRTYTTTGKVQLIRVPEFEDFILENPITSPPWNGKTGGVIAIITKNTFQLNASIDVSGKGFRGAFPKNSTNIPAFQVPDYVGINTNPGYYAPKGEGIAEYGISPYTNGKGAPANGGGGGNNHNAGGAGGGNYGCGGNGGYGWKPIYIGDNILSQGLGGYSLNNSNNKIFFGGGGGAGHTNENDLSIGGNGGGIVIIIADEIISNSKEIVSNGTIGHDAAPDGAAGGGAGGTILISANKFKGRLSISCKGDNGGNNTWKDPGQAPGGGGGGGAVLLSVSALPQNVEVINSGGQPGIMTSNNQTFGAKAGCDGGILYNLIIPVNNSPLRRVIAAGDTTICNDSPVQLRATGALYYKWEPSISLDNDSIANPTANPKVSTRYIVRGVDSLGCISSDTLTVSIDSFFATVKSDTVLCNEPLAKIQLWAKGGSHYKWSSQGVIDDPNSPTPVVSPSQTTIYYVEITSDAGCSHFDSITIRISPLITPGIRADTSVCLSDNVQLWASGGTHYRWIPADGLDNPNSQTPIATATTPRRYFVEISNDFGCSVLDSMFIDIKSLTVEYSTNTLERIELSGIRCDSVTVTNHFTKDLTMSLSVLKNIAVSIPPSFDRMVYIPAGGSISLPVWIEGEYYPWVHDTILLEEGCFRKYIALEVQVYIEDKYSLIGCSVPIKWRTSLISYELHQKVISFKTDGNWILKVYDPIGNEKKNLHGKGNQEISLENLQQGIYFLVFQIENKTERIPLFLFEN